MGKAKHLRNDPFIIKLGSRVRFLRKQKGLTMTSLANACNIEYVQLSKIERGLTNTSVSHIYEISKELGIPLRELFDFDY